jgi:AcrR family transcriptional regulator
MAVQSESAGRRARTGTRAKVLQAAVRLVHERGLQAVTQARVAEAAGLRQSHVTYYFPARLDLVKAIVLEQVNSLLGGFDSTGLGSLRELRDALIERIERREMPRMLLALLLASDEDPELRAWLYTFDDDFRSRLEQAFRRHGLTPTAAEIDDFHCTVIGAALLNMHADSPNGSRRAVRAVRNAFQRLTHNARPATRRTQQR